jgi:hypothetical protein
MATDSESDVDAADLLWGADAIARAIGRSRRIAYYLLESKLIPARKVGGVWVASRRNIFKALRGNES